MILGLNIFIVIYLLLFFGVAFVWRTYQVWKHTGINAYKLAAKMGAEGITARYFRIMPWLSILVATVYVGFPQHYDHLGPLEWMEGGWITMLGIALMLMSLIWIIVAQTQMGNQWRIGIDRVHKTTLVMSGVFSRSRNPIFTGIVASALGYFLVLPNAITLLIVVLDIALIQIQVAMEEEYLCELHGSEYKAYCEKVRRWL